ncbi:hypothetical protein QBC34DRAFT_477644 [Podospora aff. communis PSN243]|uniref:F-box domain-containing protein n=1 Tax=Podospora aff. communis PSN243 TaxID=3040156 RepID=A0AAV9G7K9_9PEZI|nr:hypothetical protein QBC34DRAFT_477644 [Podospora aff. communis PSN243]
MDSILQPIEAPRVQIDTPAGPAFILKLPDEILLKIIDHLVRKVSSKRLEYRLEFFAYRPEHIEPESYAQYELACLARTCRRFQGIATPLLYRTVRFRYEHTKFDWAAITNDLSDRVKGGKCNKKQTRGVGDHDKEMQKSQADYPGRDELLYRTLMENPLIRSHCRILRLNLGLNPEEEEVEEEEEERSNEDEDGPSPPPHPPRPPRPLQPPISFLRHFIKNLLTWLSNTTVLEIYISDELSNGEIMDAICDSLDGNLQKVQKLRIEQWHGPLLPDLYFIIWSLPKLQSVIAENAGCYSPRPTYANHYSSLDKTKEPPPSLTSIDFVRGFDDDPPNLKWLLDQPLALEHFGFFLRWRDHGDFNRGWSLRVILSLLRLQCHTLRTINIGSLYTGAWGLSGVDLSMFTALEELTLPYQNLFSSSYSSPTRLAPREGHDAILSAPNLRKFTLDFEYSGRGNWCTLAHFGEDEEVWLRLLVTAAVQRRAKLRHVHLDFAPNRSSNKVDGLVWPWARIDGVEVEVKGEGILITYPKPSITEEEFRGGS